MDTGDRDGYDPSRHTTNYAIGRLGHAVVWFRGEELAPTAGSRWHGHTRAPDLAGVRRGRWPQADVGWREGIRERADEPDPVETDIDTADPDHGGIGFLGASLGRGDPLSVLSLCSPFFVDGASTKGGGAQKISSPRATDTTREHDSPSLHLSVWSLRCLLGGLTSLDDGRGSHNPCIFICPELKEIGSASKDHVYVMSGVTSWWRQIRQGE